MKTLSSKPHDNAAKFVEQLCLDDRGILKDIKDRIAGAYAAGFMDGESHIYCEAATIMELKEKNEDTK